ncbi:2-keto-3-deoxygluconate permease [Paenibacillus farraposensis]|uniref:2-keto-3-deoxygluconate permease n=1 Tax=Paenibacillus farraposensis TaxID=2807095 RepID=A0ABW4DLC5_9BACL|nr:2-keto-3-deoxygluconate permease [Paenibacillus farraposensis]
MANICAGCGRSSYAVCLTVRADTPWKTAEAFLEDARVHPGKLKMGNAGTGSIWHLAAAMLFRHYSRLPGCVSRMQRHFAKQLKESHGTFAKLTSRPRSEPQVTRPLHCQKRKGGTGYENQTTQAFVGAVLPFLVGFVLGNLDLDFRKYFGNATQALIPFFGFALGCSIDLSVIVQTGVLGILLGIFVIIITGIPLVLADKYFGGGNGTAGIAASSTAGAAVANPVIVANIKPEFLPVAQSATALVAASVIVTSILVPILTAYWSNYMKRKGESKDAGPLNPGADMPK